MKQNEFAEEVSKAFERLMNDLEPSTESGPLPDPIPMCFHQAVVYDLPEFLGTFPSPELLVKGGKSPQVEGFPFKRLNSSDLIEQLNMASDHFMKESNRAKLASENIVNLTSGVGFQHMMHHA